MSEEKKADVEAVLCNLEHELWLALKQGRLEDKFQWTAAINADGCPPYIALLTVAAVRTPSDDETPKRTEAIH